MGKRGPGAGKLRAAAKAYDQAAQTSHPWEAEGLAEWERVCAFLEALPIVSGLRAGDQLELLNFQRQFVRGVYEPRTDDGDRLVRLAALSVARGNGKSALLSGLSLAHLLGPCAEPYGECYAAALDREQAGVLYHQTRAYIEATPWMAARVNIKDWHKEIIDEENNSRWRALTSDARKAHGLAPSFWVADEVAQWRSRELWDNLATGMGKRTSALGVTISTQAADDLHFFSEMLDAEPVPTIYTQLHAAPDECDLDDPAAWAAANPALGEFLNEEQFADAAGRAIRSPSFAPSFRLLQLNQRVAAEGRFIEQADWEANGDPFDPIELEGERCFGGLDLSSTRDLTAFALYFPDHGKLLAWHWFPADTIAKRVETDRVPYDRWSEEGWAETTVGNARDDLAIALQLADIRSRFDLQGIAFDRWQITRLRKLLSDEGIDLPLVDFVPGFKSYAAAVDAFETALLGRKLQHNNNPLLRWQAGNVIVETDPAGNRKPAKNKSLDRIDGVVSAIMACGLAATVEPTAEPGLCWI
ncbi:terminase large subunit [Qipengyuania spongiae]|uniref:Terminase large subunit n=1 Tax=Qipengyuania spongiae TaxID=2909673 RepID=A0ABY5T252_9SPHN|nr:terminase TerL endonuclease subunit [Qipengyuania spongiae]UVI39336.1 terminase large subunit [Qipengyuania spongiae]